MKVVLLTGIFAIFASSHLWAAGHNWLTFIDGEKFLHELSIPGTHDTGALIETVPGTAKCQNLTIEEQLQAGVRFLDIRCRHIGNAFVIHHGSVYQELNFTDVLQSVASFLEAHPSETVIMSVKEEHNPEGNTRSFAETFTTYVGRNSSIWSLGSEVPKLNDVRSKIVLLRRFNDPDNRGIEAAPSVWPDDSTGTLAGPPRIRIQDVYKVWNRGNKWSYITSLFSEMPSNPGTLYLNFASGYSPWTLGIPDIPHVGNYINPLLESYFTQAPPRLHGIVIMDFVTARLAELVYRTNFLPAASVQRLASGSLNPALRIEVGDGNIQLTWKKWDSEPLDDMNGNGLHDQGEPFVDLNNNGKHDPAIERYVDLEFSADLNTWTTIAEGLGDGSHSVVVPPAPVATPQASASSRSLQNQAAPATAAANERGFVRIQRTTYTARAPMIRIPGGNYKGSAASSPDRIVQPFAIGKYEMTWADFQEVRDWAVAHQYTDLGGVGAGSGPLHPVHSVSWYDAVKWCNALSEKNGRTPAYSVNGQVYRVGESDNVDVNRSANGYRLPTELEWDVAFRGGPWTKGYIFSGSNVDTEVAWFNGNSSGAVLDLSPRPDFTGGTWPVGQKKANELGIHDMSGNVAEWTEEQDETYLGPIAITNILRHARGGSWSSDGGEWVNYPFPVKGELTASHPETSAMPNTRSALIGFRYVSKE